MRVVAAADLHLDATMVGDWSARDGMHSNWVESFGRLDDLVDTVNEVGADLLVIAGDVFHTGRPVAEAVALAKASLSRLGRAKVVMTNGNHDQASVIGDHRTPLDAYFHSQPWCHHVARDSEVVEYDGASIALVPWHRVAGTRKLGATSQDLRESISRLAGDVAAREGPSILAGHIAVEEATFSSGMRGSEIRMMTSPLEASAPVSALDEGPWSFAALGHIHKHQVLGARTAYIGSTYKVDFGEQGEPKGCYVIDVDDSGEASWEFRQLPGRELMAIDLSDGSGLSAELEGELRQRDRLRIWLAPGEEPSKALRKQIQGLRSRGVHVETPRAARARREAPRLKGVGVETNPVVAYEAYAAKHIEDSAKRQRAIDLFKDIYDEVGS